MGQIMKYHAWPSRGKGTRAYTKNGLTVSVNFNTVYNWENMPNKATDGNSGNTNIAKILYHAGVSAWMKYGTGSSGAFDRDADAGFKTFFKYSTDGLKIKSNYTTAQWHTMLKESLDNRNPVYYSGNNNGFWTHFFFQDIVGHAWVIDGYEYTSTTKMYHFNLGWGNSTGPTPTGMYNIDALPDFSKYNFRKSHKAIFNIQPKGRLESPKNIYASDQRSSFVLLQNFKVAGATKYKIYRTSNKNTNVTEKLKIEEVTGDIYLDRGALLNHTYYYYIKACNNDGCSKLSAYDTGIRRQIAPNHIYASDNRSPFILVKNYEVSGANRYKIYRTSASGTNVTESLKIGESTSSSYVDRTALYGHTYYYYVKACYGSVCSGYSGYDTGYRKPELSAPTSISASDGSYSNKIVIGSYATTEASWYQIYRTSSPNGKKVKIANTLSESYTDTTALSEHTYYYFVKACKSHCSEYSQGDVGYLENTDGVTVLHESTTLHGKHVGYKKMKYYKIRAKGVNVLLYNLGADIDVYIKIGSKPTVTGSHTSGDFDYHSYLGGTKDDYISTLTAEEERDIYIGVRGYKSGNYDLRVTKKY
jgi:fibronectin type 3 domain-containing protein